MNFTKGFFEDLCRFCIIVLVLILVSCAGKVKESVIEESLQAEVASKKAELNTRFERALTHQNNGENSEAEDIYKSLLAEHNDLISPSVNLGIIAVHNNKLNTAKEYFERVVQLDPNHKQSLNYLGFIARDFGEFDQAEVYYRKILALDPNDHMAMRNLGILLDLYRGRLEEALALYEQYQSLQAEPDSKLKDWIFDTKSRLKAEQ
jgi:Flp pilus assembly protein TadD